MMNLVTLPDERLFKKSEPVTEITERIYNVAREMLETLTLNRGIGLAGVQVGIMERIFVVQIEPSTPLVFINPVIKNLSDDIVSYEEGCLSIPGIFSHVDRPDALKIEAINEKGDPFSLEATELLARVIQHEYDHLDGTLFYQHLSERKQKHFLNVYQHRKEAQSY